MNKTAVNTWIVPCSLVILLALSSNSFAGTGSLTVFFKYKDANGVESPISGAYVYLHVYSESNMPIMEKYFVSTPYIYGPSFASGEIYAFSVPEGNYHIRITARNPLSGNTNKLGPPEKMDYTWHQAAPVTITANANTDLGVQYADALPITVTGTLKNYRTGIPVPGRYIRFQTEPCYTGGEDRRNNVNMCGPAKLLALQRTDAGGQYTILLRDAGTYYVYSSACLQNYGRHGEHGGNPCMGDYGGTVTVNQAETKTFDITTTH